MNKIDININNIIEKFESKLKNTGWEPIFKTFFESEIFQTVIYKLKDEAENDRRFTPKLKDIFNSFIYCPYDKLKVIIIGQDPYPQINVADGISFSCSYTNKEQPSLRYIFDELQQQYPNSSRDTDLKRWSEQGVLMLNTAFTVQIGKIGSHYELWKPFTHHILQSINRDFKKLPVALLGKKAEEWQIRLDSQNIMKVPHPASAAYKGGKWDSKNLFININDALKEQGNTMISW
jgi:uracil-DNA glycosylase